MDDMVAALSTAFQSKRLSYRAIEDTDKDWILKEISSDPVNVGLADPTLLLPPSKVRSEEEYGYIKNALFPALICLRHSAGPGPDPTAAPSTGDPEPPTPAPAETPIGVLILTRGKHESTTHFRRIRLGIQLAASFQAQGYGGEAVDWALDWAFRWAGAHRVELGTVEFNERALALYRQLGFVDEGRKRKAVFMNRRWWDMIELGMLEEEWVALRARQKEA